MVPVYKMLLNLKKEPGYIIPKATEGSDIIISSSQNIPEELPYGDILLNPTDQSLHEVLNFFRYYAMPEKESGMLKIEGASQDENFPVPEGNNLEEIHKWVLGMRKYITETPDVTYKSPMSFLSKLDKLQGFSIYSIHGGVNENSTFSFEIDFYTQNYITVEGLMFSWHWQDTERLNQVYMDKLRNLLTDDNCMDWRIGDPSLINKK